MWAALFVMLASLIVYLNALDSPFISDDHLLIEKNEVLRVCPPLDAFRFGFWERMSDYATEAKSDYYRPLQIASYSVDYRLGGGSPAVFHLTNVLMHVGTSLLVYLLGRLIFCNAFVAFGGALLFAVHPIHTEAVSWIASRGDVMVAAFACAAFGAFVLALRQPDRVRSTAYGAVSSVALLGMLLCKENALTFIFPMGLWLMLQRNNKSLQCYAAETGRAAWGLLAIGTVAVGTYVFLRLGLAQVPLAGQGRLALNLHQCLRANEILARYFAILSWPWPLNFFRLSTLSAFDMSPVRLVCSVLGVALLALIGVAWRRWPAVAFCLAWIVLTFLPVLDFIPLPMPLAERSAYLPSIAYCWLLALLIGRVLSSGVSRMATLGAVVVVFGALTMARNVDWSDERAFWTQTWRLSPTFVEANKSLAMICNDQGAWSEAENICRQLIKSVPDDDYGWSGLSTALEGQHRFNDAIRVLQEGTRHADRPWRLLTEEGVLQTRAGRPFDAEKSLRAAIAARPSFAPPRFALGVLLASQKRWDEAVETLTQLVDRYPRDVRAIHNLAVALRESGRSAERQGDRAHAIECYRQCLKIWDGDARSRDEIAARLDRLIH